jgi:hypothetical protein
LREWNDHGPPLEVLEEGHEAVEEQLFGPPIPNHQVDVGVALVEDQGPTSFYHHISLRYLDESLKGSLNIMELPDGSVLGKKGEYAHVNGAEIYFEDHGEGEPVLMLHGAWSSVEGFLNQAGTLCAHHRIIIPERRGHGRSPDI